MASLIGELGNLGGKEMTEEEAEQAQLIEEQRQEQENERKARHEKMEAEREVERQRIRDKYGLKKKEKEDPEADSAGRISRKKKTPAEMQAAMGPPAEEEEQGLVDTVMNFFTPLTDKISGFFGK
ncbi:complexin-like isoform X2 [Acanthaster planci]|uniref:Complexin-like isoform X2 n=1 Tax=Acanthaster planci TaxID=133434 RepID=A0A8B7YZW0_ACAPL|nr:complexin-like isoform X2 [Acanthaster planci]